MTKLKAIFFDRDGVVNYRPVNDYVKSISEFHFIPEFPDFFILLKKAGFICILISNQQGVGKQIMSVSDLDDINTFMQKSLYKHTGFMFDDVFYCTELKTSNSYMRKPNPGMLIEAIGKWNIDVSESWMIGDSESDILAGKRAGVKTALLTNQFNVESRADVIAFNLTDLKLF